MFKNNTLSKTLKQFGIGATILAVLSTTLAGLPLQHAFADVNAQWVDKFTIILNGNQYHDYNPFDGTYEYQGEDHGNGCDNTLKITNYSNGATEGTLNKQTVTSSNKCVGDGSEKVTLTSNNFNYAWTAYRVDENTVYMPVFRINQGSGSERTTGYSGPSTTNGVFKRFDSKTPNYNENEFINTTGPNAKAGNSGYAFKGETGCNENVSGEYLDISKKKQYAVAADTACKINDYVITLANDGAVTEIPKIAGYISTDQAVADPEAPTNAELQPTCESNNGTLIIGWLVCSMINAMDSIVETAGSTVNQLLEVNSEDVAAGSAGEKLHNVWAVFRAFASFALIGVALAMIIGQAIGGDN